MRAWKRRHCQAELLLHLPTAEVEILGWRIPILQEVIWRLSKETLCLFFPNHMV